MISPRAIIKNRKLLRQWRRLSGYSSRKIISRGRKVDMCEYVIPVQHRELDGKTIFFFSDLHWDGDHVVGEELIRWNADVSPDWVICGGDLISYSCHMQSALELISRLKCRNTPLVVPGNWDKKRYSWFPQECWEECYARAGFKLLLNSEWNEHGVRFWGTDDFKLGNPVYVPAGSKDDFSILLAHNPDTLIKIDALLDTVNLVLCGHTHAGQIRVPRLGALRTSSLYWRKFDCGEFLHTGRGTHMLVSAGLGCTGVDFRLFARREVMLVRLKYVNQSATSSVK